MSKIEQTMISYNGLLQEWANEFNGTCKDFLDGNNYVYTMKDAKEHLDDFNDWRKSILKMPIDEFKGADDTDIDWLFIADDYDWPLIAEAFYNMDLDNGFIDGKSKLAKSIIESGNKEKYIKICQDIYMELKRIADKNLTDDFGNLTTYFEWSNVGSEYYSLNDCHVKKTPYTELFRTVADTLEKIVVSLDSTRFQVVKDVEIITKIGADCNYDSDLSKNLLIDTLNEKAVSLSDESKDLYDKDDLRDDDGYLFFDSDAFYKSPESYWNSLIEQEEPKEILNAVVNNIEDSY